MENYDLLSLGWGIGVMLTGWGLALLCVIAALDRKVAAEIQKFARGTQVDDRYDCHSANEAIYHRIKEIEAAYNIRAFTPELEGKYLTDDDMARYDRAILSAVRSGITWVDVCSPGFLKRAARLIKDTKGLQGKYTCKVIDQPCPILNFIVLRFKDHREEVWFGWPIEPPADPKTVTFRVTDPGVVDKFKEWHRALLVYARDC